MITESVLEQLCQDTVQGYELTTKHLNHYGLSPSDLHQLVERGTIQRQRRGLYLFTDTDRLLHYGKKLLLKKEYQQADICFGKCSFLDPSHIDLCYHLLYRSLQTEDYDRVFSLIGSLLHQNQFVQRDMNYFLYLLCFVKEIPDEYQEYVKKLEIADITVCQNDTRYQDVSLQNSIRVASFRSKFYYAYQKGKAILEQSGPGNIQGGIQGLLLSRALLKEKVTSSTILQFVQDKQYDKLISYLEKPFWRQQSNLRQDYILCLLKEYQKMKHTFVVPMKEHVKSSRAFEAIDAHDYTTALRLSREYNDQKQRDSNSDALNLLLRDICSLISLIQTEEEVLGFGSLSQRGSVSSIISCLMKKDFDRAFLHVSLYLESIHKSEYESLIVHLIRLSVLERDSLFMKPVSTLTLLSHDAYLFSLASYVEAFYVSLTEYQFDQAKIYLDIIRHAEKIGQTCVLTNYLCQIYEMSVSQDSSHECRNGSKVVSLSDSQVLSSQEACLDSFDEDDAGLEMFEACEFSQDQNSMDEGYLEQVHDTLLCQRGIVVSRPICSSQVEEVLHQAEHYRDIHAFVIGSGAEQRVVFRYHPFCREKVDFRSYNQEAIEAKREGDYVRYIDLQLTILQALKGPNARNYVQLGLAYLKIGNKSLALDYLTVGNELARKEESGYDYTDLISRLSCEVLKQEEGSIQLVRTNKK